MKLLILILATLLATGATDTRQRIAIRQLSQKAASGDPRAIYDLAMLHDIGYDSIPVDSARSSALYRIAAERGYGPAQNYLGFRYFNGEAIRQDTDSALFWMAKAAAGGDAKAANNLGYLLANSDKVSRDYQQAVYWLTKAADAGLPAGMSQLADLLRQGLGCSPDTARAESLYTRAIQAGLHDAELKLIAMKGHAWENLSPDSALTLAKYHYTHGAPLAAVTLFENIISPLPASSSSTSSTSSSSSSTPCSSSTSGYPPDADPVATAFALLGDAYSRGAGVAYDHDRSVCLYKEAALRGNPSAQFVIAELLDIFPDAITFEIPEQNTAAYWYDRAASRGITDARTASSRLLQ